MLKAMNIIKYSTAETSRIEKFVTPKGKNLAKRRSSINEFINFIMKRQPKITLGSDKINDPSPILYLKTELINLSSLTTFGS